MSDMTKEQARERLESLINSVDIQTRFLWKDIEAMKCAISALSTDGEYIKKEEIINHLAELGWISDEPFNGVSIPKEVFDEVPTYSFPDSAKTDMTKPESDLISRTQAINDYAQCFADEYGMDCGEMFIGVLHQCPTFPDSAENKGEWIESKGRSKHWYCSACGGIHTDPEICGYVESTVKSRRERNMTK